MGYWSLWELLTLNPIEQSLIDPLKEPYRSPKGAVTLELLTVACKVESKHVHLVWVDLHPLSARQFPKP